MFLESQNFVQSLTPKIFWCTETGIEVSLIGKAKSHFEGPMTRAYVLSGFVVVQIEPVRSTA